MIAFVLLSAADANWRALLYHKEKLSLVGADCVKAA